MLINSVSPLRGSTCIRCLYATDVHTPTELRHNEDTHKSISEFTIKERFSSRVEAIHRQKERPRATQEHRRCDTSVAINIKERFSSRVEAIHR